MQEPLFGEPLRLIDSPVAENAPEEGLGADFLADYNPGHGKIYLIKIFIWFLT